jgi:hypothetical protein
MRLVPTTNLIALPPHPVKTVVEQSFLSLMRLCHETNKRLDQPIGWSQRSVKTGRTGCRPLAMDKQRPSRAGGFNKKRFVALGHDREPRNFWGCEQPGAGCLPGKGKPQCLDPEG